MRYIIYLLIAGIVLSSCGTQKKMLATSEALAVIKKAQEKEKAQLDSVARTITVKLEEGKIDKNISFLISKVLKKNQDKIDSARKGVDVLDLLMTNQREFRIQYKSVVLPYLDSLRKSNELAAERMSLYRMVEEGLNVANYQLFDMAAFFGPGKYTIPEDKIELVLVSFAPIIDSLILFSNKFNDVPRTGTIVLLGFADGTGFSDDGPLIDTLTTLLGKSEPTKEELNQKLSQLRAEELTAQLKKLFVQKSGSFSNIEKIRIDYIQQGKGEEFPMPYKKDYTIDDERRRIVLCYWVVLPD